MRILVILLVTIMILLAGLLLLLSKNSTGNIIEDLPSFAKTSQKIREAYEFAVENPDALIGVNCSCGCMRHQHDGRIHSRGLYDCFIRNGGFERHGSQCDMCINAALDVKQMTLNNMTKDEIKAKIYAKYGII